MKQYEKQQCERKSKKHWETDLEWDGCHGRSDKEHQIKSRAAKSKVDKLPPQVPSDEKTLTVKMPQTAGSTEPLPL